ncbi:MAG: hypothetical protein ABJM36_14675 [Algibacter sp.]|uniref:hypothetical protein n=1 Tax=Algibacter sp. TaxID=1872428 RepID=UPI0032978AFC
MATIKPITHIFSEINVGKYKCVKHYELTEVINGTTQFSELINISKNQHFAKSMPVYWFKERNGNKWQKFCTTGLFKSGLTNIFKGDKDHKKHLIVFKFSENAKILKAYFFKDFYTKDLSNVLQTINL